MCHPERVAAARGLCWPCYKWKPRTRRNKPEHFVGRDIKLEDPEPGVLKVDDLIRLVADLNQTSYKKGREIVYAMLNTMIKALRNKEEITIKGFGWWRVIVSKPSPHINICTKQMEKGRPRVWVHFRLSDQIKRMVKECVSNSQTNNEP